MAEGAAHLREVEGLHGDLFKLVSQNGTLLGTVLVPPGMVAWLCNYGHVRFFLRDPRPVCLLDSREAIEALRPITGTLCLHDHHYRRPDSVMLWGCTPEQYEAQPGCAFFPGAAYLRSLIE